MDWRELRQKITEIFQKYRYVALVLLAGIILMLLPMGKAEEAEEPTTVESIAETKEPDFEVRLSAILSQMEGAGRVQVFLSQAAGEQTLYQADEDLDGDSVRRETVILTDGNRAQWGLVQQVNPPVYQGAIVLCQGADSAAIRLAITQAVANATGLGANQISVLKMK